MTSPWPASHGIGRETTAQQNLRSPKKEHEPSGNREAIRHGQPMEVAEGEHENLGGQKGELGAEITPIVPDQRCEGTHAADAGEMRLSKSRPGSERPLRAGRRSVEENTPKPLSKNPGRVQ